MRLRGRWLSATALASLTACSTSASSSTPGVLPGRHLTRTHFEAIEQATNVWPLTIDSRTLSCVEVRQGGHRAFAVVFTAEGGTQYALNRTAENTRRYHPGREVYRPTIYKSPPGTNSTWLIGYGLRLCPHYRPDAY